MMGCNGICARQTGSVGRKKSSRESYYSSEFKERKYCSVCETKIITEGTECFCCGFRLRTRPRNNNNHRRENFALITIENEPFMDLIPQIKVEIPIA